MANRFTTDLGRSWIIDRISWLTRFISPSFDYFFETVILKKCSKQVQVCQYIVCLIVCLLPAHNFHLLWKKVFGKGIDTEGRVSESLVLLLPDRGGSLKRLHRPNLLGLTAWVSRNTRVSKSFMSLNPVCPQRGPYEASEGIYHGRATKPVVGKHGLFRFVLTWFSPKLTMG